MTDSRKRTLWQFVRFSTVGGINTSVDFGTYVTLTRGFSFWSARLMEANIIAYGLSVTVSFMLNNFWTFGRDHRDLARRAAKFLTIATGALGLNSLVFWSLTHAGVLDLVAKACATLAVSLWNFSLYKLWAFEA